MAAVLPPGEDERQACGLEEWGPGVPEPDGGGAGALGGLASPHKRKWGGGGVAKHASHAGGGSGGGDSEDEVGGAGRAPPRGAPHSREARDAKSGKGRRRLFLHPVIRSRDRCGTCPVGASVMFHRPFCSMYAVWEAGCWVGCGADEAGVWR
jgi:hypothetical protein